MCERRLYKEFKDRGLQVTTGLVVGGICCRVLESRVVQYRGQEGGVATKAVVATLLGAVAVQLLCRCMCLRIEFNRNCAALSTCLLRYTKAKPRKSRFQLCGCRRPRQPRIAHSRTTHIKSLQQQQQQQQQPARCWRIDVFYDKL
jgi:hypothetical protein